MGMIFFMRRKFLREIMGLGVTLSVFRAKGSENIVPSEPHQQPKIAP
jgi:hypothetical protein